ncbi:MAG TPA: dipeptidase [Thermoanaerobaculia bacterium]|jgi:acetylornithine deacetylase/succinyl-diaminopimelate desuccinylase-like protein|nr:dipeptidase [Thermoanaerobaculia bacterium]
MAEPSGDVLARVERDQQRYLAELEDFLRIPSISTDPEYALEVDRASRWLLARMQEAGLSAERIDTAGHPLVYGEWLGAPGRPTVLFYGHYDVQPVDPLDEWRHPPFEPTREGDNLVARGATDDKGQSYTHVKAVEAMLATRGKLPVNVKFLIEGEEESGGAAIEAYVEQDGSRRLACDCIVVSDSSMYGPGQPSLVYGLRGMAYMELRVQGPNRDLHSGTYGGAVVNPLNALCQIIAGLKDSETGKVRIPGFYDRVREIAEWERREIAALPFATEAYTRDLGVGALGGEEGYGPLERATVRPTLDVNGVFGGYMGRGAKTVLPAWGGAKVSMRLVPDQEPEDIGRRFCAFVQELAPPGVTVSCDALHGGKPILLSTDGPYFAAAMAALADTFGAPPLRVREGGSIPVVNTFTGVLQVPVLLMGYGLPDDRLHSPNEKMSIPQFFAGIRCTVRLLDRLGAQAGNA